MDCTNAGGDWDDVNSCTGIDCDPMVCCHPDGTCTSEFTSCTSKEGSVYPTCDDCPEIEEGICCIGTTCLLVNSGYSLEQCGIDGGTHIPSIPDCTGSPCDAPDGACCFEKDGTETCQEMSQSDCKLKVNYFWHGGYSTCAVEGEDCGSGTGACCIPEDDCYDNYADDGCVGEGGEYYGDGSVCKDHEGCISQLPDNACCYITSGGVWACSEEPETESECENLTYGGYSWNEGETCDDVICETECVACPPPGGGASRRTIRQKRSMAGDPIGDTVADLCECHIPRNRKYREFINRECNEDKWDPNGDDPGEDFKPRWKVHRENIDDLESCWLDHNNHCKDLASDPCKRTIRCRKESITGPPPGTPHFTPWKEETFKGRCRLKPVEEPEPETIPNTYVELPGGSCIWMECIPPNCPYPECER